MLSYAITDPQYFNLNQIENISQKADMILFRDKTCYDYKQSAQEFIKKAKKYNFDKIILHQDIHLATELNADGIHLTSSQINDILIAKKLQLFTIVSTHTFVEAIKAQDMGADMITFSPIFSTPNKGKPVGLKILKELTNSISIPVIALGGIITKEQIKLCQDNGASGFASIRYFNLI
jgi:thiamine-phosphate pyrophosphorylase